MHILVTGGAGFIGSHIVKHHLEKGDIVHAVDDLSTGSKHNIANFLYNPKFHFDKADILTWSDLEKVVSRTDRIYHMAAIIGVFKVLEEPIKVLDVNIKACERMLKAVCIPKRKPRLIIASSSSVYGNSDVALLKEKSPLIIAPVTHSFCNYAISKLVDEALALTYFREFDIPVTIIRLFNNIGPRQTGRYGMVVPRFIKQAISNEPITVFGNGKQTRSFCDVRDTVEILDLLATTNKSIGEIVNVGNNKEISINQLAKTIKNISKSTSIIKHIPYKKIYGEEYAEVQQRHPDLTKLHSLIDYKYKWILEKTIRNLVEINRWN